MPYAIGKSTARETRRTSRLSKRRSQTSALLMQNSEPLTTRPSCRCLMEARVRAPPRHRTAALCLTAPRLLGHEQRHRGQRCQHELSGVHKAQRQSQLPSKLYQRGVPLAALALAAACTQAPQRQLCMVHPRHKFGKPGRCLPKQVCRQIPQVIHSRRGLHRALSSHVPAALQDRLPVLSDPA